MGDFVLHLRLFCPLLPLAACGLERQYNAYQDLAESVTQVGIESTIEQLSTGSLTGESTSTGTAGLETDPDPATSLAGTETDTSASSTSEGTTTTAAEICGNGLLEAGEECDASNDSHCSGCVRDRLVFVTSQLVVGNFADEADLDYMCDHLAAIAGLMISDQRHFRAWISTSSLSAAERLHHSRGRYVLRNDAVFAESWDAIIAGDLQNPLNITELNTTRSVAVWTETLSDGSAIPGAMYCEDWGADDFGLYATWGHSDYIDGRWTQWPDSAENPADCSSMGALYCFEQG